MKTTFETAQDDWFDELPIEIQNSVSIGLKQSENNEGISHKEALRLFRHIPSRLEVKNHPQYFH